MNPENLKESLLPVFELFELSRMKLNGKLSIPTRWRSRAIFPNLFFFFFFVGREDIFRIFFFQDCSMKSYLILDMIFPPNFELSRIALCKKKKFA